MPAGYAGTTAARTVGRWHTSNDRRRPPTRCERAEAVRPALAARVNPAYWRRVKNVKTRAPYTPGHGHTGRERARNTLNLAFISEYARVQHQWHPISPQGVAEASGRLRSRVRNRRLEGGSTGERPIARSASRRCTRKVRLQAIPSRASRPHARRFMASGKRRVAWVSWQNCGDSCETQSSGQALTRLTAGRRPGGGFKSIAWHATSAARFVRHSGSGHVVPARALWPGRAVGWSSCTLNCLEIKK